MFDLSIVQVSIKKVEGVFVGFLQKYMENDEHNLKLVRKIELVLLMIPSGIFMGYGLTAFVLSITIICFIVKQAIIAERERKNYVRYRFSIWFMNLSSLLERNNLFQAVTITMKSLDPEIGIIATTLQKSLNEGNLEALHTLRTTSLSPDILRIVCSLFRMNEQGFGCNDEQFQRDLNYARKWIDDARIRHYEHEKTTLNAMGLIPLLTIALLFLSLMGDVMAQVLKGG